MEGAIVLPHLGASTPESEDNCAVMAADELIEYLENGNIRNSVNYPAVEAERTTDHRICVLHKNVPTMLTQISGCLLYTSGGLAGALLPTALASALGIALYAMFVAIVVPQAKKSRAVCVAALLAVALACLFRYLPGLNLIPSGWALIFSAVEMCIRDRNSALRWRRATAAGF